MSGGPLRNRDKLGDVIFFYAISFGVEGDRRGSPGGEETPEKEQLCSALDRLLVPSPQPGVGTAEYFFYIPE